MTYGHDSGLLGLAQKAELRGAGRTSSRVGTRRGDGGRMDLGGFQADLARKQFGEQDLGHTEVPADGDHWQTFATAGLHVPTRQLVAERAADPEQTGRLLNGQHLGQIIKLQGTTPLGSGGARPRPADQGCRQTTELSFHGVSPIRDVLGPADTGGDAATPEAKV